QAFFGAGDVRAVEEHAHAEGQAVALRRQAEGIDVERLVGRRGVLPFRIFFSLVVFIGCTTELEPIWNFSDVMNGLMALPNLLGILILSGLISRETKHYLRNDPNLTADKSTIEAFMDGQPGWAQWKAGDVVGSSRRFD
ncbi:MAG: alanine:cation symporter family protein, partial [Brevibacterium sp.]|nr:alanine:cation symporter family protein [Brevibacterium sp.]